MFFPEFRPYDGPAFCLYLLSACFRCRCVFARLSEFYGSIEASCTTLWAMVHGGQCVAKIDFLFFPFRFHTILSCICCLGRATCHRWETNGVTLDYTISSGLKCCKRERRRESCVWYQS